MTSCLRSIILSLGLLLQAGLIHDAMGCSPVLQLLERFDGEEYIFTGRVTGIVSSPYWYQVMEKDTVAWGVTVEPVEAVHLPARRSVFNVYPFTLDPACGAAPLSEETIRALYEVGTPVVVVAKHASLHVEAPSGQLMAHSPDGFLIEQAISFAPWPEDIAAQDGYFEKTREAVEKVIAEREAGDASRSWLLALARARVEYELRRDLLRLEEADRDQDKVQILAKVRGYLYTGSAWRCPYWLLVREHLDAAERREQLNLQLVERGWEPFREDQPGCG